MTETALDPKWGKPTVGHDPYLLAGFEPRPTDVLITSAPKAGTTWMQQILHQLRAGGDEEFESIFDVVPWLELARPEQSRRDVLASFARLPNPRVFKTHCTHEQTPGSDTVKIVMTTRDPRDCVVSYFHHMQDLTDDAIALWGRGKPLPRSWSDVFEAWLGSRAWYRNVASWWPHRNHPNVLMLRYEDLKQDLEGAIARIVAHLGWEVSRADRRRAAELSSFEWMVAHASKFQRLSSQSPVGFKPGGMIRKGLVGEGKARLSREEERRILAEAHASLEPECLAFLGL